MVAGVAGPKEPAPAALSCGDKYADDPCASPPLTGWALLAVVAEPEPQAQVQAEEITETAETKEA